MRALVILAVGCSSPSSSPDASGYNGQYVGTVTATGSCVPSTVTLTFANGGISAWSDFDPGTTCTVTQPTNGAATISCHGSSGEVACQNGGTIVMGSSKLELTTDPLAGTFTISRQAFTPPSCVAETLCDGSGTVMFDPS